MDAGKKADALLLETGMHPEFTDITKTMRAFFNEMDEGLCPGKRGLRMIPTYLAPPRRSTEGSAIALDAGGTNLRRALVSFGPKHTEMSAFCRVPMPGSMGRVTAAEFIDQLAELVLPLVGNSSKIGLCYSFPALITPGRDGIAANMAKEVRIEGIEGLALGAALKERLRGLGAGDISVVVTNDAAACLMGGATEPRAGAEFGGWVSFILGTGFNCSYVERGDRIKKLDKAGDMIINTESGNFNHLNVGEADKIFDGKTANPGEQILEKMVSGAYHGGLITETARLLARAGLFSERFRHSLEMSEDFSMRETDAFLSQDGSSTIAKMCEGKEDKEAMRTIILRSYERAARLICAAVGAMAIRTRREIAPQKLIGISAEGSVFEKCGVLRNMLMAFASQHIFEELGLQARFVRTEDCVLKGAAAAALYIQ